MLGRTANGIFWMFRYLERAKNTARLLDAGFRLALTHGPNETNGEWQSLLVTIGQDEAYLAHHDDYDGQHVTDWILRGKDNPNSVLAMIENARSNARAVRTALTREVWEATNETWMVLRDRLSRPIKSSNLGATLAVIRRQSTLVRGAMDVTMLRNEIYNFARIGSFIERADNTARILDVKYYLLLPAVSLVGSSLDDVQWETILRSVSADRAYRWLHSGKLDARGIASFMMLDERFPRSLAFCYSKVRSNMAGLTREYGSETQSHELVRSTVNKLHEADINSIFDYGLHQYIGDFLAENQQVADAISRDYRFVA